MDNIKLTHTISNFVPIKLSPSEHMLAHQDIIPKFKNHYAHDDKEVDEKGEK